MTVYLVVDDDPNEYKLIAIYKDKKKAEKRVKKLKKRDPYTYQHFEVYPRTVID